MNDDELSAYGKMAEALTLDAYARATTPPSDLKERVPSLPGLIFYHHFESALEHTASILCRLKIMKGIDASPDLGQPPICFSFHCEIADAHSTAIENWRSGPLLNELIEALFDLNAPDGDNSWGFWSDRSKPFGKGGRSEKALKALAKAGYLHETDEGFVWTELVAR